MQPEMHSLLTVGLTGGIATGKTHCLRWFAQQGVAVIDADRLAREAIGPGSAGLAAVVERFGSGVVGAYGLVDRAALARLIFQNPDARRDLEAIVHPFVYRGIQQWFERMRADRRQETESESAVRLAMADVPLLYETGHESDFDRIVVAACPPAVQLERLMARDRLSQVEARSRIDTQWPIDHKRARAHYVIDTDGSLVDTERQCAEALTRLRVDASRQR